MKKTLHITSFLVAVIMLAAFTFGLSTEQNSDQFYHFLDTAQSKGQLKVTPLVIKDDTKNIEKHFHYANVSGINFEKFHSTKDYVIKVQKDQNIFRLELNNNSKILSILENSDGVDIEENILITGQSNDTSTTQIEKISTNFTRAENKIFTPPKSKVVVALIDSGLSSPEQFSNHLAINKRERQGIKNFDDDRNGYKDDIYGWSALRNSGDFTDTNGHGTHLSGILMAFSNMLENPEALQIIPIQVLDENNQVKLSDLLVGLDYAKTRQADIVNLSIGTKAESKILKEAIKELTDQDITVVASAGNNNENAILNPANYSEVLAISALNNFQRKAKYANYGQNTDFSIKGGIISLGTKDKLTYQAGTSQAAALFSGLLSIEKLKNPQKSTQETLEFLQENSLGQDLEYQLGHKLRLSDYLN